MQIAFNKPNDPIYDKAIGLAAKSYKRWVADVKYLESLAEDDEFRATAKSVKDFEWNKYFGYLDYTAELFGKTITEVREAVEALVRGE